MKIKRVALALLSSALISLGACSGDGSSATSITVAGSTTVLPIAELAAEKYESETGNKALVSGMGSSAGIEAVINGTADIATSSRGLTEEEQKSADITQYVIALDGIAVIVNTENPVKNLSLTDLRDIYAGKIKNWSEVGGDDLPIQVLNRDEASGTREAFKNLVMEDAPFDRSAAILPGTGQVRDVVSRTKGSIGYISVGLVESKFTDSKVNAISINRTDPTEQAIATQRYPISRSLYLFTVGEVRAEAKEYIELIQSKEMEQTIRDAGFLPAGVRRSVS